MDTSLTKCENYIEGIPYMYAQLDRADMSSLFACMPFIISLMLFRDIVSVSRPVQMKYLSKAQNTGLFQRDNQIKKTRRLGDGIC